MQPRHSRLAFLVCCTFLGACGAPPARPLATEPGSGGASAAAEPALAAPSGPRERALEAGLCWLARHQLADGSWRVKELDAECRAPFERGPGATTWIDHYDVGSTALGLLAFVRSGWTRARRGEIGGSEHVAPAAIAARAWNWLRAQQCAEGFFTKDRAFLYNEALATLALAEHFGATKDEAERAAAQRAVDFLQRAQRPSPSGSGAWGWRYQPRMEIEQKYAGGDPSGMEKRELYDSDVSVTGWACAALVSAAHAGLAVDPAALAGAREFVRWCTARDGLVGYNDPRNAGLKVQGRNDHFLYHPTCMSAIGLRLALEGDARPDDAFVLPAAKRISMDAPTVSADGLSIDYYYWLHATLAFESYAHAGGERYLGPWTQALEGALFGLQERESTRCGRGGWLVPDRWSYAAGPIYTTSMALLALAPAG